MQRTVIAVVIALVAILVLPASGMATKNPINPVVYCDGPCSTDPTLNSLYGTGYSESAYDAYDFTNGCTKRTRVAYASISQIGTGITFAKSKQIVQWCLTGTYIKWLKRDRMPVMERWPVSYLGHTWSSCTIENCSGVAGSWQANIGTQEKFQACLSSGLGLICKTWYGKLNQYVNGAGAYSWSISW